MNFEKLNINESIIKALKDEGFNKPTPIQEQAIPYALKGRDLFGCAQTGTGKTAAFAIPVLQKILIQNNKTSKHHIQALVLTPTRELAAQIENSFRIYGRYTNLKYCSIFGGVSQNPQVEMIKRGVDILIATPGRLIDLLNQKFINLQNVSMFVLDEADQMLDMGFINDVKKIISVIPSKRQTMFFSATIPNEITNLVKSILVDPIKVAVTPVSSAVDKIKQNVYYTDKENKKKLLVHLIKNTSIDSALVFTRTKHEADNIVKYLLANKINSQAIHGNKSQGARQLALNNFKSRDINVLVATDIAARGIDISELSHVINFNIPNIPETYVHRIGRTGRAGLEGIAISLCDYEEKEYLKKIQKLINKPITVINRNPYPMLINMAVPKLEKTHGKMRLDIKDIKKSKNKNNNSIRYYKSN